MRHADGSETGFTLTELLVALVIGTLLATAVFTFFLNSSQIITNQSSTTDMWQRGRNALALVRQAVESAGFGLPQISDCPNGIAAYNSNQTASPFSLTAITASVQSSGTYDPTNTSNINTYSLMTVAGGASFGNAPAAQISS
ncbi:prepilin-type N-terminal cleavage/methylation domain-containing protein, partial [Acidithiobacillus ferrooxidans]|nr:prepilin-type N-terminal cleavage/methylation domain-containing protein [Acidithiobacillus ferrooxidans]